MPEWLKGADCKSAVARLRWFESTPAHHLLKETARSLFLCRGVSHHRGGSHFLHCLNFVFPVRLYRVLRKTILNCFAARQRSPYPCPPLIERDRKVSFLLFVKWMRTTQSGALFGSSASRQRA